MTAFAYAKIDAFTAGNSLGNPAACLYLQRGERLSDADMLAIAKRHKGFVSEVVYCEDRADGYFLTYYSSECEVDFCGHGTIACMIGLIRRAPALLHKKEITIETHRKGALTVYNRIPEQGSVLITAPAPVFLGTGVSAGTCAAALGLPADAVGSDLPVECIDAGLRTLIVPLRGLTTEVSVFPDEKALKGFCQEQGADILLIFCAEAQQPGRLAHTRVFAPKFGYLEDPATGSGNSAFGYYMLKHGLWDGSDCVLEQGGCDHVYNEVRLCVQNGAVLFGGGATVRIDGVYYV